MSTTIDIVPPPEYKVFFTPDAKEAPDCLENYHRVQLNDGSILDLPLQPSPNKRSAIALLMSNETSFEVENAIVDRLYHHVEGLDIDVVVGVPTLGLGYAREIAKRFGHPHYVPLGQSRKFWYKEIFSQPASSITSLGTNRHLYIDPALVARVKNRRVLLVDDVVTTAGTALAALQLLKRMGAHPVNLAVALTEGDQWVRNLDTFEPDWSRNVICLGHIPLFKLHQHAWQPQADKFFTP